MRIDAPIITGSFSLNGDTFNDLGAYTTTGSNTFIGNQSIVGAVSASALTGSISYTNLTNTPTLVSGSEQVVGIISQLNSFTASNSTTNVFTASIAGTNAFTASLIDTNTFTSSTTARLNSIETISSSNISRIGSLETISASNVARLNSLEIRTGSLATTGSNTFIGTQTITGSLFISSNLIVQGTSSLQNITASAVSIGTNIVNLNTANPAIRYAGLVIGDSGSVDGSGSFLYDSVQDEMIFVHRGTSTIVTSSVVLMGPQTFDNIGTETYPTNNRIQKGTGNEHLVDSNITDNGTIISLKSNADITGSLIVTSTISSNDYIKATLTNSYNGDGIRVYASTTSAGGSQPGIGYWTAAGSKRFINQLDVSSDTWAVVNASGTNLLLIAQNGAATLNSTLSVSNTLTVGSSNEFLKNQPSSANVAQFQTWFNSAGTRRGYFGYGTGGSNQLEINNESGGALRFISGDTIADGNFFRMKGDASAEFIWHKNYSGNPSEPGFVINNRAGTTTFSHNANGGGTSILGNFVAGGNITANGGTVTASTFAGNAQTTNSVIGGNGGSFTVGGNTSNFYPVLFGIGSSSTSRQGIAVLQIERGGYDDPGYSNYTFSTFHARFRAKADGWGYGASYVHLEQHAYTVPMMANFLQNNFSSELVVWLRGNTVYQWMSIEGGWGLANGNAAGGNVTNAYGGQTYSPQSTNDVAGLSKWYTGWSTSRWSGNHIIDPLGGSGNRAVYSDASGQLTNSSSDITLKTNIENINYGLDSVLELRPVTYNWMDSEKMGTQKEIGFIAQEVQTHIPEVIGVNNDETLSLDYPKLTAVLTNAIKEQQVMINELKSEIEILKNK